MSESEKPSLNRGLRERITLRIRRDDHIGDPIGIIFLDPTGENEDAIVSRLRDYLGRGIRILKLELKSDHVDVLVEAHGWREESTRLAAAAEDLRRKGVRRNASEMFQEAVKLDPLNRDVATAFGLLLAELGHHEEALRALKRAREIAGDRVDVLKALAQVCVDLDRTASAISYLERALELEPDNQQVRKALVSLGRAVPTGGRPARRVSVIRGGRKG